VASQIKYIDKCKSVSYCTKHTTDTGYHTEDRNQLFPLEKVKSMVDIGVHFDNKINKAYNVLGIIKRNFIYMDEHITL